MKKLALKLDDLRIDTFATEKPLPGKGTVQGHYGANHTEVGMMSCDWTCGGDTCDYTCGGYATSPGPQYPCIFCG